MKRFLYYFISLTWDCLSNIMGSIVALVLILTKHEVFFFGPKICIVVGQNWGGLSLGIFTIISRAAKDSYHTLAHEYGHSLQGLILGPLSIPLVLIWSASRYHIRNYIRNKKGYEAYKKLPPYDSIWFERTATKYGYKYSSRDWLKK